MRYALLFGTVLLVLATAVAGEPVQRTFTFEDRVDAQRAIEGVYYSHQIEATKPFETAVPRAVLEAKVHEYLHQTAALKVYWKTEITDEMLQRELERMAAGTRMPERLHELFAALGNESFLVKECLARPALVDRLSRNFFAFDRALHHNEDAEARSLHDALARSGLPVFARDPRRSETVIEIVDPPTADSETASPTESVTGSIKVAADEFLRWRAQFPARSGDIGPVREEQDAFVIRTVLEERPGQMRVVTFTIVKRTWDEWWNDASLGLDSFVAPAVAAATGSLPRPASSDMASASCEIDDRWNNRALAKLPGARSAHTAVWTGTLMLTWGGTAGPGIGYVNTGSRYDPSTDTWTPMSTTNAPEARIWHTAMWTGDRMIVWGGRSDVYPSPPLNSGGRYDPLLDVWTPTSLVNAPSVRWSHTAVWTKTSMIVWGGFVPNSSSYMLNTGARYDPVADSWTATSTTGAPSPRQWHTAVWTGSQMIVWGGDNDQGGSPALQTGGRYDPTSDSWTPTRTTGAAGPRSNHTAVWTGTEMIVWGGANGSHGFNPLATGGRYDPIADSWSLTSTTGAPSGRMRHTATWTGNRMVVWGGSDGHGNPFGTGASYDADLDAWTPTSSESAPSARFSATAIWTGQTIIVWGGGDASGLLESGGRYDPARDSWTPTAMISGPTARYGHTAVWTGNQMLIWGGQANNTVGRGAGYDPATDTWSPITTSGEPSPRGGHVAVWTGDAMVIWGGYTSVSSFPATNTGGRYDPISDGWTQTSTAAAPSARSIATAVWTGTEMLVWGGGSGAERATGGRYNPATDTWASVSTSGAPSPRSGFTNVWSGSVMIVWGGSTGAPTNTGGVYSPASDSWTATSTVGAPKARTGHRAVWTGSRMIVWGGDQAQFTPGTGGRYDPVTDSWQATATGAFVPGLPAQSIEAVAWTGLEMIVWFGPSSYVNSRYNPVSDSWRGMRSFDAPSDRSGASVVWTGDEMILWGGYDSLTNPLGTGGRYFAATCDPLPTWYFDGDGDGYGQIFGVRACCQPGAQYVPQGGDCHDARPSTHPGAPEVCNGFDDNCDGQIDEDAAGVDTDSDGVRNACDNCPLFPSADLRDADLDGVGDVCDNCPKQSNPAQPDSDADSWGDACDNCSQFSNTSQSDFDHDGEGDICDLNDGRIYIYSTDQHRREWQAETGYTTWNVYRGSLTALRATGLYTQAPGSNPSAARDCGVSDLYIFDVDIPASGEVAFNLVTGMAGGVESGLGTNGVGVPRPNANPCP